MDKHQPYVEGAYYGSLEAKQPFLRALFDRTARHYDRIGFWGWLGTGGVYRRDALRRAGFRPHMRAIDVASGTGPVAKALVDLANDPSQVVCVEPSSAMLAESRKAVPCTHYQSTAENLPVEDASFDFLTMGFALRHVHNLEDTFAEYHRVLKPEGKVLILELTKPQNRVGAFLFRAYFKHVLPRLSWLVTLDRSSFVLMRYYWESMDQMIEPDAVMDIMRGAGFEGVKRRVMLGFCSEYEARRGTS